QMEIAVIFFALLSAAPVAAQISGQDVRNTSIPDMNTHFQMPAFASRQEWFEKAAFLRKQILSSAGLLPMPEKTPLRAQIFGRIEHPDYTVKKVLLATTPAFTWAAICTGPAASQVRFRESLRLTVIGLTAGWRIRFR